jgi:prepilin-type N-terminal cleavage/methylation domain-containing protein
MSSSRCPRPRAFTLIEVMVVIVILTLLLSGLALPIAAQLQVRRAEETRRILEVAREALLGFAASHGRLPCPATESSAGEEAFAPGGDAANGNCETFYGGWLPAAALGLSPVDAAGFMRDAWDTPRNRVRYAVFGNASVNGVANPLTRAAGLRMATLPALGAAPHYVFICSTGASASASGCGPAANQLTRRAAFVLLSTGANAGATPAAGGDEARNLAGAPVFVHHEMSIAPGREYDDVVQWVAVSLVVSRLMAAGQLP